MCACDRGTAEWSIYSCKPRRPRGPHAPSPPNLHTSGPTRVGPTEPCVGPASLAPGRHTWQLRLCVRGRHSLADLTNGGFLPRVDPPDASPTNPSSTSFGFGWLNNSQPKSTPPPSLAWRNQTRGERKVSSWAVLTGPFPVLKLGIVWQGLLETSLLITCKTNTCNLPRFTVFCKTSCDLFLDVLPFLEFLIWAKQVHASVAG